MFTYSLIGLFWHSVDLYSKPDSKSGCAAPHQIRTQIQSKDYKILQQSTFHLLREYDTISFYSGANTYPNFPDPGPASD